MGPGFPFYPHHEHYALTEQIKALQALFAVSVAGIFPNAAPLAVPYTATLDPRLLAQLQRLTSAGCHRKQENERARGDNKSVLSIT
jgi:hypothetical protein